MILVFLMAFVGFAALLMISEAIYMLLDFILKKLEERVEGK